MGSFDVTCSLSDIGISCSDNAVLYLAISQNNSGGQYSEWTPITTPIVGKYDDYGNFEVKSCDKFEAWLVMLRQFIVEKPQGSDPYHGQAVTKEITEEQFWRLRHSDRISVTEGMSDWQNKFGNLAKAQLELQNELGPLLNGKVKNFYISGSLAIIDPEWGATEEKLLEIESVVSGLGAVSRIKGNGGGQTSIALINESLLSVFKRSERKESSDAENNGTYQVKLIHIRKDVWDAAKKVYGRTTAEDRNNVDEYLKRVNMDSNPAYLNLGFKMSTSSARLVFKPSTFFSQFVENNLTTPDLVQDLLDFEKVFGVAGTLRRQIRPQDCYGPQCASESYSDQIKWFAALEKIVTKAYKDCDGEMGEEDMED